MGGHIQFQPDLGEQQRDETGQADTQAQVGDVDQLDDGNQDPEQVDLEHSPFAQVVISAVEQHAGGARHLEPQAQQHQQLAQQLEQGNRHAAQQHQHGNPRHTAFEQSEHTGPDRFAAGLPEERQVHDRQEVGRDVEEQGGQDQGEAATLPLMAMHGQLEAATWAATLFTRFKWFPAHEQVAFMAGDQRVQGKVRQVAGVGRGHRVDPGRTWPGFRFGSGS